MSLSRPSGLPIPMRRAEPESSAQVERRALAHLRAELTLIRRIATAERERVAVLAEQWGHAAFAQFLREPHGGD